MTRPLSPGSPWLSRDAAYAMLVEDGLAPAEVPAEAIRSALTGAVADGQVAGVAVATGTATRGAFSMAGGAAGAGTDTVDVSPSRGGEAAAPPDVVRVSA